MVDGMNLIRYKDTKDKKGIDILAVRLDVLYDHINVLEVESRTADDALRLLKYEVMVALGKVRHTDGTDQSKNTNTDDMGGGDNDAS